MLRISEKSAALDRPLCVERGGVRPVFPRAYRSSMVRVPFPLLEVRERWSSVPLRAYLLAMDCASRSCVLLYRDRAGELR